MITGLNRICTHNQKRLIAHHLYLSQRQYQISPRGPRPLLLSRALHSSTHRHFLCLQGCHYMEIQKSVNFHLPSDVDLLLSCYFFLLTGLFVCGSATVIHYQGKKILKYSKAIFLFKPPFAISLSSLPLFHITLIFCSLISGSRQLDAITQQPVSQA